MSEFKDKITKQVEIIDDTIKNEAEKAVVMNSIQELIKEFTTHLVNISEYQNELEEQIVDLQESVVDIQNRLGNDESFSSCDDEEEYGVCPYCGEEIFIDREGNKNQCVCPFCHNTIEIED